MTARNTWRALPYLCIVGYLLFIFVNLHESIEEMDSFYEHPYHVARDLGEMRARLQTVRNSLSTAFFSTHVDWNHVEQIIADHNRIQAQLLHSLEMRLSPAARQLLPAMEEEVDALHEARLRVARVLHGATSPEHSVTYYNNEIVPPLDRLNEILLQISADTDAQAKQARRDFIIRHIAGGIFAVCLGAFLAGIVYLSRKREKAHTRAIVDREALFNLLARTVDDVFFITGSGGAINYASTNSQRVLNVSAEEIAGRTGKLLQAVDSDSARWLVQSIEDFSNTEVAEKDAELLSPPRKLKLRVYPVASTQGAIQRHIVVISDQTEFLERQQVLSDALENSRRANAAKTEFLGHMSHEIRTPMNAIIGMTAIAQTRLDDRDRVQSCLDKISHSSRHLLGLINDMLDMSRIEGGRLSLNLEPINLLLAMERIADMAAAQASERGLRFTRDFSALQGMNIKGDPLRVQQVLLNLFSNAIKFTDPGGEVHFSVETGPVQKHRVNVRFVIRDSGIGMSQSFLEKIYRPFEQAGPAISSRYGGAGLGLAITANLVSLMSGIISISSQEGVGTEVAVEIPFATDEEAGSTEPGMLPSMKILVVDDDPDTCEHATLLLERMGMRASTCSSGAAALELLAKAAASDDPFNICFVDWKMPDMDGAELSRIIRRDYGGRPYIVVMSAYDWSPIEKEARSAGVATFMAKPFFPSSIFDILSSLERPVAHEAESSNDLGALSGKRVLLVDDNEFNREVGTEFLEMANMVVDQASNGEEAVQKFVESEPGHYHLVCMDLQMPVMDGYEAARAIRASSHPDAAKIPIIAMSANSFQEDIANSLAAGMNAHVAKPVNVELLFSEIRKLFRQHQ